MLRMLGVPGGLSDNTEGVCMLRGDTRIAGVLGVPEVLGDGLGRCRLQGHSQMTRSSHGC